MTSIWKTPCVWRGVFYFIDGYLLYRRLGLSGMVTEIIMISGSKGLNPHELAYKWIKDL